MNVLESEMPVRDLRSDWPVDRSIIESVGEAQLQKPTEALRVHSVAVPAGLRGKQ